MEKRNETKQNKTNDRNKKEIFKSSYSKSSSKFYSNGEIQKLIIITKGYH